MTSVPRAAGSCGPPTGGERGDASTDPVDDDSMRKLWPSIVYIATGVLVFGCGGEQPVEVPDRAAFDAAVESYLERNSMDLVIVEYRGLELGADEDTARGTIALEHAGDMYGGMQVRFEFAFERRGDRWEVTGHRKAK